MLGRPKLNGSSTGPFRQSALDSPLQRSSEGETSCVCWTGKARGSSVVAQSKRLHGRFRQSQDGFRIFYADDPAITDFRCSRKPRARVLWNG